MTPVRKRFVPPVLAFGVLAIAWGVGCRAATQIELEITSDVACERLKGLEISLGESAMAVEQAAPSVRSRVCDGSSLGNLFVQPAGSGNGPVFVRVVAGVDVDVSECAARSHQGCVIARRELRFARGTTVHVKIPVLETCVSESCAPDSTCASRGTCVASTENECLARQTCRASEDGGFGNDASPDGAMDDAATCVGATLCSPCLENYCGASLMTDSRNCGRCGHDCLDARCIAGKCEEKVVIMPGGRPIGLAMTTDALYGTNELSSVYRGLKVPADAGTAPQIFHSDDGIIGHHEGVATTDTRVYFASRYDGIYWCLLSGCPPVGPPNPVTVQGTPYFRDIATTSTQLVALGDRSVFVGPKDGSLAELPAGIGNTYRIAADATYAYFTTAGTASRLRLDGTDTATRLDVVLDMFSGWITVSDDSVYWTSSNGNTTTTPGHIRRISKSTGAVTNYPTARPEISGIAVDACNVYWALAGTVAGSDGEIHYCPIDGCAAPRILAQGLSVPQTIIVDGNAVYATEYRGGRIRRIIKP